MNDKRYFELAEENDGCVMDSDSSGVPIALTFYSKAFLDTCAAVEKAATSAADARYQEQLAATSARVRELEEALRKVAYGLHRTPLHQLCDGVSLVGGASNEVVVTLDSGAIVSSHATTPDTALQRHVLEKRDEAIRLLMVQLDDAANIVTGLMQRSVIQNEEIENLQAKLAMQAEAVNAIRTTTYEGRMNNASQLIDLLDSALNTAKADVDNWMQGKKAEWEKGVFELAAKMVDGRIRNEERYNSIDHELRKVASIIRDGGWQQRFLDMAKERVEV